MTDSRPLLIPASQYDTSVLLAEWQWLTPKTDTPLFISIFGDWVFGNPNGSLWVLSLLKGTYEQVAANSNEYNTLNKSAEWIDQTFIASWQSIAAGHGLIPEPNQCLGWKVHPLLGGSFEPANLQLFNMSVYQSLMGQLHRQLSQKQTPASKKPWFQFW
ncbi:T6SS immunity protein Tdi1 domain-containing protein [Aquipseudomonas alcaligenes]|uniref:T6SS immunity protein Tdi1 domain-containing protein n=1 Tax=Aquipseudomonas alcaligenes TaxID=43263 RepID=UPI001AD7ECBC|nr:T6SS immunity protein Tdi1 domain-containing protein [Pseudomonas alcaligenes]